MVLAKRVEMYHLHLIKGAFCFQLRRPRDFNSISWSPCPNWFVPRNQIFLRESGLTRKGYARLCWAAQPPFHGMKESDQRWVGKKFVSHAKDFFLFYFLRGGGCRAWATVGPQLLGCLPLAFLFASWGPARRQWSEAPGIHNQALWKYSLGRTNLG